MELNHAPRKTAEHQRGTLPRHAVTGMGRQQEENTKPAVKMVDPNLAELKKKGRREGGTSFLMTALCHGKKDPVRIGVPSKCVQAIPWGFQQPFQQVVWNIWTSLLERTKSDRNLTPYRKTNSKLIKDCWRTKAVRTPGRKHKQKS